MSKQNKKVREGIEKLQSQLDQAILDGDKKQQDRIRSIINCLKTRIDTKLYMAIKQASGKDA